MAYQTMIFCTECSQSKQAIASADNPAPIVCSECRIRIESERREKYFAELDKLTVEERIRKIEEWIYNYQPTYVPPPRF